MLQSSLCVHQKTYAYSCTGGLLLVNLARRINEGDLTNSCRIMVFSGVLTRFLGTYSWSELGRHQKRSWICTFWPPPKETPATRAVKFPHLCLEFFLVWQMRHCAWHMRAAALTWVGSQVGSSGWPQRAAMTCLFLSVIGHDTLHHIRMLVQLDKHKVLTFHPTLWD